MKRTEEENQLLANIFLNGQLDTPEPYDLIYAVQLCRKLDPEGRTLEVKIAGRKSA